jgi:ATP-binding cassette subfamily B protein
LAGKAGKFFIGQQQSLGKLNGYIEEMITGQKIVKVFNHEEKCKEEFDELNGILCENAFSAGKFTNMMGPINNNLGYVQYSILAIVGGFIVVASGGSLLSLGSLMAFMTLSRNFNQPINNISQQFNSIIMALAGAERIFDLMDQEPETDNGYVTLVNAKIHEDGTVEECAERTGHWAWKHPHQADGTVTYTELKGDIVMDMVDFAYVPEKQVLYDVTLYAHPGQKIAFVGATGAGKTTITNLINRFYDIADGKVRYDGININKIKKADLRRSLGVVLQETNLFTGSVMENIRYGKLDATDEECIQAAKLANAHDFITRLPEGYDTQLTGNGASLSQGQRQLISIARAAVADPPVMILDEATSSIDTRTEALVQKGMDALMHGRTTFVIAHRLSTVQNSDCIMVLDHGHIIERGSHEDLIAQKGTYYQLYTGAFELE